MSNNKFYITTAIAYTNAPPHIGHAFELLIADVIARYQRLLGKDVRFLTGTDEHGITNAQAAKKAGVSPKTFTDKNAYLFKELIDSLDVSYNDFIRTSDEKRHWPSVVKIWQKLLISNDIYKKSYQGLYCIGHEAFIKESDLVDGVCPDHKTKPEVISEENYFFRLSKYTEKVKKLIETDKLRIVPESRKNEILSLLRDGLEDVSFSRPVEKLKWGIPVPGDETQTIYVWADALTNYISALGYGENAEQFKKYWPADTQVVGKDILRFHAAIWPAMLLSAGEKCPLTLLVHGFITSGGIKMSKTVGNIVDPFVMIEKYGAEALRYFLLREISTTDDGDFTREKFEARYQADLANGLGNIVARVSAIGEKLGVIDISDVKLFLDASLPQYYKEFFEEYKLHEVLKHIWEDIGRLDKKINDEKPWELKDVQQKMCVVELSGALLSIARLLSPFLPKTAEKIKKQFHFDSKKQTLTVKRGKPLFPRLEK